MRRGHSTLRHSMTSSSEIMPALWTGCRVVNMATSASRDSTPCLAWGSLTSTSSPSTSMTHSHRERRRSHSTGEKVVVVTEHRQAIVGENCVHMQGCLCRAFAAQTYQNAWALAAWCTRQRWLARLPGHRLLLTRTHAPNSLFLFHTAKANAAAWPGKLQRKPRRHEAHREHVRVHPGGNAKAH